MASSSVGNAVIAVLVLCALVNSAAAVRYTVGQNVGGWVELSPATSTAFDDQFRNITLVVGDTLLFPYTRGVHNVYQVSRADLATCNGANPIAAYTDTNTTITLNTTGYHGYICEIPGHCTSGAMHLAVTVSGAAAPAPSPTPTPSPTPSPTPAATPTSTPTPSPSSTVPPPAEGPSGEGPSEAPGGSEEPSGSGAISLSLGSLVMVATMVASSAILAF